MCKGSVLTDDTRDAERGERLAITMTSHGSVHRHGVLHRPGEGRQKDGVVACATCIKDVTSVVLSGIPPKLRAQYRLRAKAKALFVPGEPDKMNSKDKLRFENGRELGLWRFADVGIELELAPIEPSPSARPAHTTVQKDLVPA